MKCGVHVQASSAQACLLQVLLAVGGFNPYSVKSHFRASKLDLSAREEKPPAYCLKIYWRTWEDTHGDRYLLPHLLSYCVERLDPFLRSIRCLSASLGFTVCRSLKPRSLLLCHTCFRSQRCCIVEQIYQTSGAPGLCRR